MVPNEDYYFEELSDLFYVSKKGGKNYREALRMIKKIKKLTLKLENADLIVQILKKMMY